MDNIDSIIKKLLSTKKNKPGKKINLQAQEIILLCEKAQKIFASQPMLL